MRVWSVFDPTAPGPIGSGTPGAITGTTITATTKFLAAAGTAAAPSYSFTGDLDTGFYNNGANSLFFSSSATLSFVANSNGLTGHPSFAFSWAPTAAISIIDTAIARNAAGVVEVNNGAAGTFRDLKLRALYVQDATFLARTNVALNDGAAAASGTLTNAPTAGNPTKWIPIDDNGTTRYIPAW